MPAFDDHYSDEQREALVAAYDTRTAKRVAQLAGAGELTRPDGTTLPAFFGRDGKPVPEDSIRSFARDAQRRRKGEVGKLADIPHRDAIEALRRRLVNAADSMMTVFERQVARAAKNGEVQASTVELGRQVARLILEASRLPGPADPRPASPGTRDKSGKRGPETRGGLAGALLKDHRGAGQAPEPVEEPEHGSGPDDAGPDDGSPGALVAAAVARMS